MNIDEVVEAAREITDLANENRLGAEAWSALAADIQAVIDRHAADTQPMRFAVQDGALDESVAKLRMALGLTK